MSAALGLRNSSLDHKHNMSCLDLQCLRNSSSPSSKQHRHTGQLVLHPQDISLLSVHLLLDHGLLNSQLKAGLLCKSLTFSSLQTQRFYLLAPSGDRKLCSVSQIFSPTFRINNSLVGQTALNARLSWGSSCLRPLPHSSSLPR